jgi:hypothetical protein
MLNFLNNTFTYLNILRTFSYTKIKQKASMYSNIIRHTLANEIR